MMTADPVSDISLHQAPTPIETVPKSTSGLTKVWSLTSGGRFVV